MPAFRLEMWKLLLVMCVNTIPVVMASGGELKLRTFHNQNAFTSLPDTTLHCSASIVTVSLTESVTDPVTDRHYHEYEIVAEYYDYECVTV